MRRTGYFIIATFLFVTAVFPCLVLGQADYPTKPIQILIGVPPGGSTDILVRTLGNEAKQYLGQQVMIVNKPGAAATLAATQVAMAKPDGYTLGVAPSITFTSSPFLLELPVDLEKESTPILSFAKFNVGIVVKSDSPFTTLKDFLESSKRNPGKNT